MKYLILLIVSEMLAHADAASKQLYAHYSFVLIHYVLGWNTHICHCGRRVKVWDIRFLGIVISHSTFYTKFTRRKSQEERKGIQELLEQCLKWWDNGIWGNKSETIHIFTENLCPPHRTESSWSNWHAVCVECSKIQRAAVKFLVCWPQYYPPLCMQCWLFFVSDWNPNWNAFPCSWKRRLTKDFNISTFNLFFYKDKYISFTP